MFQMFSGGIRATSVQLRCSCREFFPKQLAPDIWSNSERFWSIFRWLQCIFSAVSEQLNRHVPDVFRWYQGNFGSVLVQLWCSFRTFCPLSNSDDQIRNNSEAFSGEIRAVSVQFQSNTWSHLEQFQSNSSFIQFFNPAHSSNSKTFFSWNESSFSSVQVAVELYNGI